MAAATDENTGVAICSWKDDNIVAVASNVHGVEPLKPTERGAKSVLMPHCVAKYNEGMLGVDLADWKTQIYRVGIKSKKMVFFDFYSCFGCCSCQCLCYIQPNAEVAKVRSPRVFCAAREHFLKLAYVWVQMTRGGTLAVWQSQRLQKLPLKEQPLVCTDAFSVKSKGTDPFFLLSSHLEITSWNATLLGNNAKFEANASFCFAYSYCKILSTDPRPLINSECGPPNALVKQCGPQLASVSAMLPASQNNCPPMT